MANRKGASLRGLIRRLVLSFSLTVLGSWGLIIPRLGLTDNMEFFHDDFNLFYFDLGSLAAVLLGLFMTIYYRLRLAPRLKRVEELGEESW
jgi:hypothetical protein